MKKNKLKACVIGLGKIGFENISKLYHRNHCDNYFYSNFFSLEGATDINLKKKKLFDKRYNGSSTFYESVEKMLIDCAPSIISICVPPDETYKVLKKIKNINKYYIFLEKPISNNAYSLSKIISLLQYSKNKIIVNYFRAWDKNNINFINKLKNNNKCKEVIVKYSKDLDSNASHIIYMLISIFGKISNIRIFNKHKKTPSFILLFKSNIIASFIGIRETKNNFCEANFITDHSIYSFEAAGCRYSKQIFKKNIFYKNYYQLSNHENIFKEKELNVFGSITKMTYEHIVKKHKKNFSNFNKSIEVANALNYIKNRL